ncbi:MAG: lactate utilization protein [Oscillospiraceae bacterium]|jgi:L-lactate utilization protein LutB|nr:lactate utilization protein [Oscillospiraceae bacterium]MDD3833325.1 lactate utilization protein [Oscillospiraceae bacterium]MDD4546610.1 lactate utilization protein [Oscillospiraceae bacterium]
MHPAKNKVIKMQIEKTMRNLQKNNIDTYYVDKCQDVKGKVAQLLNEGDTVAVGGSETLKQTGVIDLLRSGKYNFLDRYAPHLDAEGIRKVFIGSFSADVYLSSSNAVTMKGELYNVDGNSNRIAAICFGPKTVIMVVGCNKIVPDIKAAETYVKSFSAPSNAVRLNSNTYCAAAGHCQGIYDDYITSGCSSEQRICSNYLISAHQSVPGRIKVILVGEELGF